MNRQWLGSQRSLINLTAELKLWTWETEETPWRWYPVDTPPPFFPGIMIAVTSTSRNRDSESCLLSGERNPVWKPQHLVICTYGHSHWGRNTGSVCSRTRRWGTHVRLAGTSWQGSGEDYIRRSFMLSPPHQISSVWSKTVSWAGNVARMGGGRGVYSVLVGGDPREGDHMEDLGIDGRIILTLIFM